MVSDTGGYLTKFDFEGAERSITYIETTNVTRGVRCDIYQFHNDSSKDLGVISISAGCTTHKQQILKGEKTLEGYLSGKGKLSITSPKGEITSYFLDETTQRFEVDVQMGHIMQWEAHKDSELEVYEICFPPYEEGRFRNLD